MGGWAVKNEKYFIFLAKFLSTLIFSPKTLLDIRAPEFITSHDILVYASIFKALRPQARPQVRRKCPQIESSRNPETGFSFDYMAV